MKAEINGVQITLTDEQVEQIRKHTEKPKNWWDEWMPDTSIGHYNVEFGINGYFAEFYTYFGNKDIKEICIFKREQAELMAKKVQIMIEMQNFASLRNDGWVANWEIENIKWGIEHVNCLFIIQHQIASNYFVLGIAVKSKKIAEEMLCIFGDRIKEVYNVQY